MSQRLTFSEGAVVAAFGRQYEVELDGGGLALCGLVPAVRDVMSISGFDNILPLAADRAAALDLLK